MVDYRQHGGRFVWGVGDMTLFPILFPQIPYCVENQSQWENSPTLWGRGYASPGLG